MGKLYNTMYLMTYLAIAAGGTNVDKVDFFFGNVADKYEDAKWKFISASGAMPHPHIIDSYMLMLDGEGK